MIFPKKYFSSILLWFSPVLLLVSWFPFWVLLVFLSYWLVVPKLYLFHWVKLELSLGAHLRLLFTEIWMLWLCYLCIRGFQETMPLDEANIFFWLRYFLLIPISVFMLYRTFRPRTTWLSQKFQQAQDYLQKDILRLLGFYLEHHETEGLVLYWLRWLEETNMRKLKKIYLGLSLYLLLIPLILVSLGQFWAFFIQKDLTFSWLFLPLLILPRLHQLMMDFIPFFLEGSQKGIQEIREESPKLNSQEDLDYLDRTQLSLNRSWDIYLHYRDYLAKIFAFFTPGQWFLVLLFSLGLIYPYLGSETFLDLVGPEAIIRSFSSKVKNILNAPPPRYFSTQAFRVSPRGRKILDRDCRGAYKRGHLIFIEDT